MLKIGWKPAVVAVGLAVLAGCTPPPPPPAPPPPPPPPPPPAPVVEVEPIPYRPVPPAGAPYVMDIPRLNADGVRVTVNHALDEQEAVWHFRSGWNVAALNCLGPDDEVINTAYGQFLSRFPNGLASSNRAMDQFYRRQASSSREALRLREAHATQVYNYFALPGARRDFCNAARLIANEFPNYVGDDVKDYAVANLPLLESAFERFFSEYERYEQLSAEWDREYGAEYGASQPGYVAVYGAEGSGVAASLISGTQPSSDGAVSTPIVQPLPNSVLQGD